jgi:glycoprotein-N-acetylgalactosamine 3-beta-galactosyltransferase
MVYTLAERTERMEAQKATWGHRCDKFIFMGDEDNTTLPMVRLEFEGPQSYINMWRKSLAMWRYVHAHMLEDFDYFYICGQSLYHVQTRHS